MDLIVFSWSFSRFSAWISHGSVFRGSTSKQQIQKSVWKWLGIRVRLQMKATNSERLSERRTFLSLLQGLRGQPGCKTRLKKWSIFWFKLGSCISIGYQAQLKCRSGKRFSVQHKYEKKQVLIQRNLTFKSHGLLVCSQLSNDNMFHLV